MEGNVIGLEFMEFEGQQIISVYEEFELDGWNTVRLSTPDGGAGRTPKWCCLRLALGLH